MKRNQKIVLFSIPVFILTFVSSLLFYNTSFFPKIISIIKCPFHSITGLPCATCGFTRCVLFVGAGNFFDAFKTNPFAFLIFLYLFFLFFINLFYICTKNDRYFIWPWKIKPQESAFLILTILMITWIYKIIA
ncbi:MAG: DUF2752 domain-containing protein [Candidatus Aureabacteria bacterium]|nr:DUF2752 domain-containing protein [Candidatus Auribacterota bacterium]